jgi:micrococcal nuclease
VIALALAGVLSLTVIDGDSINTNQGGVRLVQVNTPEVGQCWHDEAKALLKSYLKSGGTYRLEADPALDNLDKYGRRLRYLHRGGININIEIVRQGAGVPYFYKGKRGKYSRQILTAMYYAKANKLGQWGHCKTGENK